MDVPPVTARLLGRVESVLFSPDRHVAAAARIGLALATALVAALLVGFLGPLYAVAGVLALLACLLVLTDLRWGLGALFAVIGLLPFAAFPVKIIFTPTFLDFALAAVFVVWIVRIATRRQRELISTPLGAPVLVFVLLMVLGFANGLRYGQPTVTTIRNFAELTLGILIFFLIVNNSRTQVGLDLIGRLILLTGAGAGLIAIVFYVIPPAWTVRVLDALARFNYPGGFGALRYIEDDTANPMRAIGTMVDPNVLGGFMILMGIFAAAQVASERPLLPRRWLALILGLDLLTLYLTYSRGSLLGLAFGFLVIGVLRYRRLLLIMLVGGLLLLLLPPAQAYVAHLVEGLLIQDRATLMRIGEYRDALALISRYPWLGVGFGGSPDANLYVGVSNLYLLMAEQIGVVGVGGFLVIVSLYLSHLFRAWRHVRRPTPEPARPVATEWLPPPGRPAAGHAPPLPSTRQPAQDDAARGWSTFGPLCELPRGRT